MKNTKKIDTKNLKQRKQRGASLVEYALLVALISVVAVGTLTTIGTGANAKLAEVSTKLN